MKDKLLDNQVKYNIFAIPFLVAAVMWCYITVALVNSSYFFERRIIVFAAVILAIWAGVFFLQEIRGRTLFRFSLLKAATLAAGILLGFWYVRAVWFNGYLNLEPLAYLFRGDTHIDTMFHTDIAESFLTNGFPSIQMNGADVLHYHVLSHFVFALLSYALDVPALITYNYLYPVLFFPLYLFLLQHVVVLFRKRYGLAHDFSMRDLLFFLCFLLGFNFFSASDRANIWTSSILISESFLVASVLMLVCAQLFLLLSRKHPRLFALLLLPVFLFLMTAGKVSVGFIFFLAAAYYLFRKNPKSPWHWLLIIGYAAVFLAGLKLFNNSLGGASVGLRFYFFHFARTYIRHPVWLVVHYVMYMLPALFLLKYRTKGRFLSKVWFSDFENVWAEMMFLVTLASWLPGMLLEIAGGSAEYFCFPAYILSCEVLWGMDVTRNVSGAMRKNMSVPLVAFMLPVVVYAEGRLGSLFSLLSLLFLALLVLWGMDCRTPALWKKGTDFATGAKPLLLLTIVLSLFLPQLIHAGIKDTMRNTVTASNKESLPAASGGREKLARCFSRSDLLRDSRYASLIGLRQTIRDDRGGWCLFLADDCWFYDVYDYDTDAPQYVLKPEFAAASLYGVPVLNALYAQGDMQVRGDGNKSWRLGTAENYGISTIRRSSGKITSDSMRDQARLLGKSHIAVLSKYGCTVVDVD